MTSRFDYVIVGGGMAGAAAVEGIRELDDSGTILMLGDESEPPYQRPPLSKEYLQNPGLPREMLHLKPEAWFEGSDVSFLAGRRVVSLDAAERTVELASGETFTGGRVLLATGGRPRTLPVAGADREGVFTLRTVDDSEPLQRAAASAERAVLIGAGFIGMELAASLRTLDVRPVVVELADRVWPGLLPPELSRFMQAYFEERGVEFRLETGVAAFEGPGSGLRSVELDGGETIPCELAVVGVGISPATELAEAAGLEVDDGIVVDERTETSGPGVFAAGDVARFPDGRSEAPVRIEHWDHAKMHGRAAGRNMAGAGESYDHLSYFFSDTFDLGFNVVGEPARADEVIVEGELGEEPTVVYCGCDGTVCGVIMVDAPRALEDARELVRRRASLAELG